MERKSFPEATKIVLDTLGKGESFSISELSKQAGLNRRTVEKSLEVLAIAQNYFLERKLEITPLRHAKIVQLSKRSGLLNLPENLQKLIIRTVYYPSPSREEEILVYAYIKDAFSPEKAIEITKSTLVKKLLKQGQLIKNEDGRIYLSDEGKIVAEGALNLYPELKNI
jgi:hypothetical protein